jgi:hypothetical protein
MEEQFDPTTFPAQQFTGVPPSSVPQGFNQLPVGAREFARQYLPGDDDAGCIGSFETVKEHKPAKSRALREKAEAEGRVPGVECDVYEDVTYVRISIQGNDKLEVHRPAYEADKKRFPFAWQEFMRGASTVVRGTPLTVMGMDAPMIRSCQAKNIFCIEDMAKVTDTWLQNLGTGAREWRSKAAAFIETTKYAQAAAAEVSKSAASSEQLEQLTAQLGQALQLLQKQTAEIEALKAPKKRGRPKAIEE